MDKIEIGNSTWNNLEKLIEVKGLLQRGQDSESEKIPECVIKKGDYDKLAHKIKREIWALECYHNAYEILQKIKMLDVSSVIKTVCEKYNSAYRLYSGCISGAKKYHPDKPEIILYAAASTPATMEKFPSSLLIRTKVSDEVPEDQPKPEEVGEIHEGGLLEDLFNLYEKIGE